MACDAGGFFKSADFRRSRFADAGQGAGLGGEGRAVFRAHRGGDLLYADDPAGISRLDDFLRCYGCVVIPWTYLVFDEEFAGCFLGQVVKINFYKILATGTKKICMTFLKRPLYPHCMEKRKEVK